MLKRLLNALASRAKGRSYVLDARLPASAVLGLAARRLAWLLRGRFRFPFRSGVAFIGDSVVLRNKRFIELGRTVTIGRGCIIDGLSVNGVRLGSNVNIGPYTTIQATGVLTQLGTGCTMGDNSAIGGYSFIGCGGGVTIGKSVIMGQYISFHSENHVFERVDVTIQSQGVTRTGIVIEDDCWVGAKATFLDGCHVGRGCVVAAGSVVKGQIPAYSVIGGVPARILRSRLPQGTSS
jgi:acetyltransferase-like isoleucine patch superfamily enzyme